MLLSHFHASVVQFHTNLTKMMQESSTVDDQRATNVELEPKPDMIEDGKDGGPSFRCNLYNTELVHKIAEGFIPGLATACVDNTCADIFKTPASVAADVRKEMVEYITQRSENFIAESVILEGGHDGHVSDHPFDIISDFVDDFASSKRNLFSRVSGWLLSEKREDNIDDFVQEMEINRFWLIDKREAIAQSLLKNVDIKIEHHCNMKFHTAEELKAHIVNCSYRSMDCVNEGCTAIFCASQADKHDAVCPFKIIPCEQNCSDMIMRRDMDRHCITICPRKLVSCSFYAVGCQSPIPHSKLEQHHSDDLYSHILFVLQSIHKEASMEDLKRRLEQLKDASSSTNLAQARDVRLLTSTVKDLEAKLGSMEITKEKPDNHEAEHVPEEVGSKVSDDVESGPKEVNNKPEEDHEIKPTPKEVTKPMEDLEAKSKPKEVSTKPMKDVEAKPAPKELSTKPAEDLEEKQDLKEVGSSKPPKDIEARSVTVEAPTRHEAKLAPKELSTKPTNDIGVKPTPNEVSSSKSSTDIEEKPVELEPQLGTKDVSNEFPHKGYEIQLQTKDFSSKPEEELEAELRKKENKSSDKGAMI